MFLASRLLVAVVVLTPYALAELTHDHPAPEKLGSVSFAVSCKPAVQQGI
jgi:hypothetical protein